MGFGIAMACRGLNNVRQGRKGLAQTADQSGGVEQKPGTEQGAGIPKPGRGAASAAETALCGRLSTAVVGGGSTQLGPGGVGFIPSCGEIPTRALRCEEAKAFPFPKDGAWQVKKINRREQSQRAFCPPRAT